MNSLRNVVTVAVLGIFIAATNLSAGIAPKSGQNKSSQSAAEEILVSPIEDLMREHGVLSRTLLIYEEIIRRLENNEQLPAQVLIKATEIVRKFIQDYHEKLEEKYLFIRFRRAKKLVELVKVLEKQHKAGRNLINDIMRLEKSSQPADKKKLIESMRSFIRMYREHKAREDTILFPEFHFVVSAPVYNQLGEEFEGREEKLFGKNGFERIVSETEELEKNLGIYELSQFTPPSAVKTKSHAARRLAN